MKHPLCREGEVRSDNTAEPDARLIFRPIRSDEGEVRRVWGNPA